MLVFFLLTLVLLVAFGAFAVAVTRVGGHGLGAVASLAALLPSLAPISFGYLLAHNLDNLAINSQLLIPAGRQPDRSRRVGNGCRRRSTTATRSGSSSSRPRCTGTWPWP